MLHKEVWHKLSKKELFELCHEPLVNKGKLKSEIQDSIKNIIEAKTALKAVIPVFGIHKRFHHELISRNSYCNIKVEFSLKSLFSEKSQDEFPVHKQIICYLSSENVIKKRGISFEANGNAINFRFIKRHSYSLIR